MSKTTNVMIVGVGGQGTLLASRIIGNVAIKCGFDVKVSEVHGMSQRGGSVVTYVKFGEKVHSPLISEGEADILLAFEQLEAYRYMQYVGKGGKLLVNTQQMDPMPVITGAAQYPSDILGKIAAKGVEVIEVDALALALEAGNVKSVNVALIGLMAKHLDIDKQVWLDALRDTVPAKFLEVNLKAFELGYR
ncbi:MAG: indolepyruvate oxidoreductase subunit beta [Ruminococcaceae bacterium]|nr:indolepyruvate oxidoreductase subunit beta [Oscillospiraceae bacterium]